VIFLGAMIVTGCGDELNVPGDTTGPLTRIEALDVVVTRVDRDDDTRTITTELTAGAAERQITIEPYSTNTLPTGFTAELSGPGGVLYHISLAWDPGERDRFRLVEMAGEDMLTLTADRVGGRLFEEYVINEDRFRVEYPALNRETRRKAMAHAETGRRSEDPGIAEFVSRYAEFQAFYSRHSQNSLHNNPDGELLVALLANEQYAAAAVGEERPGGPDRMADKTADRICATATVCGVLKCGTLVNPLCVPCGGTSLACAIAEIACWIFDCGWD
jgi:hypothetical protein